MFNYRHFKVQLSPKENLVLQNIFMHSYPKLNTDRPFITTVLFPPLPP
jgi:hypothetical protein